MSTITSLNFKLINLKSNCIKNLVRVLITEQIKKIKLILLYLVYAQKYN